MTGARNDPEKMAKLQAMLAAAAKGVVARGVKNVASKRFEREANEELEALRGAAKGPNG